MRQDCISDSRTTDAQIHGPLSQRVVGHSGIGIIGKSTQSHYAQVHKIHIDASRYVVLVVERKGTGIIGQIVIIRAKNVVDVALQIELQAGWPELVVEFTQGLEQHRQIHGAAPIVAAQKVYA